ncbi:Ornithine carbamoyltransferase, mitochondrial [Orchesella cincta]|uniref:Ornithine carbamoyltransferase, mitochondrial n=1 Tax=Orchesella cincta TaxID=48709 RepID=A0A1D2N440_ORCCI|nr:Ornithine carbamoyltransferase, mitochondrial [Orchesella cincta]
MMTHWIKSNSTVFGKYLFVKGLSQKVNSKKFEVGKTVFQSLNGRDLLSFEGYTRNEVYSLLWVATELKNVQQSLRLGKRVGLIWSNPIAKASLTHASQNLESSLCCVHENQLFGSSNNYEMLGRSLASTSDIIFLDVPSWSQSNVEEFAAGSNRPVILISSRDLSPAVVYSELLSFYETYGFLRRVILVYLGPGNNPALNTYFTVFPTIGGHLRYVVDGVIESQASWEKGLRLATKFNTEIKQFEKVDEAIDRAHAISTCSHNLSHMHLKLKDVKEMDLDWTFVQSDSHKGLSVSKDLMKAAGHSLIHEVINNQSWIFQACIAAHTSDYRPIIQPPRFEGVD